MRHLLQDFVDACLCRAFVENTCQTVCLCIATQLFIAEMIAVDDIKNKQQDQNAEHGHENTFIGFNKSIRTLGIRYRDNITDHPVIHAKPGISDILVRFFVGVCSDLDQSIFAN